MYYKLRFRREARQVVRYVGDCERAAAVARELSVLQHEVQVMRNLRQAVKAANKRLKEAKMQIRPLLEDHGFAFHGLSIRRSREAPGDASPRS